MADLFANNARPIHEDEDEDQQEAELSRNECGVDTFGVNKELKQSGQLFYFVPPLRDGSIPESVDYQLSPWLMTDPLPILGTKIGTRSAMGRWLHDDVHHTSS